jgi:hypothetical protein
MSASSSTLITGEDSPGFEEDVNGDVIKLEALESDSIEVLTLDIVLIPISEDQKIIFGVNPVFDHFIKLNEKAALQFNFLNWDGIEDGWTVATHKIDTLFNKVGFPRHKEAILAYLNRNAFTSSDGTKQCFFNVLEYNADSTTVTSLVPGEDYEPFCPFKAISSVPTELDGKKYFRFPGSYYNFYKGTSEFKDKTLKVILLGVNQRSYGSLYDDELPYENKAHYIELTDVITPRFLSMMRGYDLISFVYDKKNPPYSIDASQTHPTLVKLYGGNTIFINSFFNQVDIHDLESDEENPFIRITKDKHGNYVKKVSAVYMEYIISKSQNTTDLSENLKKVISLIISFGKRERFLLQKASTPLEEHTDPNRPFYLIIEDSIFQQKLPLLMKYFN